MQEIDFYLVDAFSDRAFGGNAAAVCPLAFGEVAVKERVKNVIHYKKPAVWAAVMVAVAAVIIGGLSVAGGKGNIIGTLLGMLFFSILANGMGLLSMNSYAQQLVKGLHLLTAVYIDIVRNKKMKK